MVSADKDASDGVRYKYGRNLNSKNKNVMKIIKPENFRLPTFGPQFNYLLAKNDSYFLYPNAANRYKNKVISESNRASTKSKDAVRSFNQAKREKDSIKKMEYMSEGLVSLSEAVSHNSNAVEPLAEMSFVASLLVESIQNNLDEQTKDIVSKIKRV